jgi:hypothetical protein
MQIFNWNDVERITGVTEHRIKYAIQRGRLGGFTMVNGAYVFGDEDVARIEKYFSGRRPWQRTQETKQRRGDSE